MHTRDFPASRTPIDWNESKIEQLRRSYAAGGTSAARRAFPELTWGQLGWGLRRHVTGGGTSAASTPLPSRDEVRARIRSIPSDDFADGLIRLLTRREGYIPESAR